MVADPVIQTLTYGPPETGQWCGICLLLSAIRIPVASSFNGQPEIPWPEFNLLYCPDCGTGLEEAGDGSR